MSIKQYCIVSGVLFSLVAGAHLLRIINGASVQVEQYMVPMTFSWVGFILPAALAFSAFRLSRTRGSQQ